MRQQRDFSGACVVVTGAAGGLGRAFTQRFARAGARLALLDLDREQVERMAAEVRALGADSAGFACDVGDEAACAAALRAVADRFGGIDVLINNAGITHRSAFAATEVEVVRRVMRVNFFGAVHCTKAALPSLIERRGLIIVISSIAGLAPLYGRTGYAASKHALHGFFGSLRSELAASGVDVLIVCPGFTATGLSTAALDGDGSITSHPQSTVGRIAQPDDGADAAFHAASTRKRLLVLSSTGRLTHLIHRISPRLYEHLMARALRRELER